MPKHATSFILALAAALAIAPTPMTLAQNIGPATPEDIAKTRDNFPNQHDLGVQELVSALVGMHRGDDHTLYINEIDLPDATPALYVELVNSGEENHPLRQQVWVPHRQGKNLRIRVSELPMGMRDLVVGMWAAPELFPVAGLNQYSALGDLMVDARGEHYTGRSRLPMPIAHEGAIEYDLRIERTADGILWKDAGRAVNGEEIFAIDIEMKTRPSMPKAKKLIGGILIYDLREGFVGASPVEKDSVVFDFSEWSMEGFLIDTTRQDHRGGFYFTIPDQKIALNSWNVGVIGLRQGGIRRIYDPRASNGLLGGEKKPFRGPLPIISELECISVKDNTP